MRNSDARWTHGPEPKGSWLPKSCREKQRRKGPEPKGSSLPKSCVEKQQHNDPQPKGAGISARTVTSVLYGRSAAVSRPQLANGEHSNARHSSAVLAEDSVLDSVTAIARCRERRR